MKRVFVVTAVMLAAWAGACTKVGGDPNAVVALSFDALPFPAIVLGDTLRDEAGVPLKLSAVALNPEGDEIADAPITFLSLDAGGTVSPDGYVIAASGTATQFRIIAQSGTLQSRPLTVLTTPAPDSIAKDGTVDTLRYSTPDTPDNVSGAVSFKLFNTSGLQPTAARGWIVHFSAEYHGTLIENATSAFAWLVDDANHRSDLDTADANGVVSRRIRVISDAITTEQDSIVVIGSATYRGLPLKGSPVRIVIQLRPRL